MPLPASAVRNAFERRVLPGQALAGTAETVARACHDMAVRFHRGGKLIVFGNGGPSTDAQHVAVEFVHPVVVGKRALPAISLTNDAAALTGIAKSEGFTEVFAAQLRLLADPDDIALGLTSDGDCANVVHGLEVARRLGLLTVGLSGGDGGAVARSAIDHVIVAGSGDPCVVKEMHVTLYHILWELVHIFFEQPGLLDTASSTGARPETERPSSTRAESGTEPAAAGPAGAVPATDCSADHCVTCSDTAVPMRIERLLDSDLALVDNGTGTEEVSVALVDAEPGDVVLVHAKEAIAIVEETP